MVVADTSAIVDYLLGTELANWVTARFAPEPKLHAPHLLDVEVLSALARLVRHGGLSRRRAREALDDLGDLHVERYPHLPLLERMWQLRNNVYARDAAFVALAEALGATLVTTDRRLSRAPGLRAIVMAP